MKMTFEEVELRIRLCCNASITSEELLKSFGLLFVNRVACNHLKVLTLRRNGCDVQLFIYGTLKEFAIIGLPDIDEIDDNGFVLKDAKEKTRRTVLFDYAEPFIEYLGNRFSFPPLNSAIGFEPKTALNVFALRVCKFIANPSNDDDNLSIYMNENADAFRTILIATIRMLFLNNEWAPPMLRDSMPLITSLQDYVFQTIDAICRETKLASPFPARTAAQQRLYLARNATAAAEAARAESNSRVVVTSTVASVPPPSCPASMNTRANNAAATAAAAAAAAAVTTTTTLKRPRSSSSSTAPAAAAPTSPVTPPPRPPPLPLLLPATTVAAFEYAADSDSDKTVDLEGSGDLSGEEKRARDRKRRRFIKNADSDDDDAEETEDDAEKEQEKEDEEGEGGGEEKEDVDVKTHVEALLELVQVLGDKKIKRMLEEKRYEEVSTFAQHMQVVTSFLATELFSE